MLDQAGGSIAFGIHARDAHLVLSRGARDPIPFRVFLDGEAPGASHGVDVDEECDGVLHDARMYQLVRKHDAVRDRTLETLGTTAIVRGRRVARPNSNSGQQSEHAIPSRRSAHPAPGPRVGHGSISGRSALVRQPKPPNGPAGPRYSC